MPIVPYLQDADCTLYNGDVLEVLRQLPDETFHMACTSPPFYGLRDYGTGSWEGGDEGCDHDQRRRERDTNSKQATSAGSSRDGVAGSTHCRKCGARRVDQQIGLEATPDEWVSRLVEVFREVRRVLRSEGTLWVEIGDSFASGLGRGRQGGTGQRADRTFTAEGMGRPVPAGCKPKDMLGAPWLLAFALRADGWYLRSEIIWAKPNPMPESVTDRPTVAHSRVFLLSKSARYFYDSEAIREKRNLWDVEHAKRFGSNVYADKRLGEPRLGPGGVGNGSSRLRVSTEANRNCRSVWTIPTQPYPEAHFATWPERLVEPMILAGSPEGGVVLDPFAGSGTTLHVARCLGRRSVGIELNPNYCELAAKRLAQQSLFADDPGHEPIVPSGGEVPALSGTKNEQSIDRRKHGFNERWKAKQREGE